MKKDARPRPYPHYKYPDEIEIQVKPMSIDQCKWHSVKQGSFELRTINYGWFPTEAVMGVVNRFYEDTHGIGADIGRNLGSAAITVVDVEKAKQMLIEQGYKLITA